jgi:hypothetical protein
VGALGKSILVGGIGCSGFHEVPFICYGLAEVRGTGKFTSVVGSDSETRLFEARVFEIDVIIKG